MDIIEINPDDYYSCSPLVGSTGFTSLMYLVKNTREHPEYLEQIKYILDNNIQELDRQYNLEWTALMIACRNSNTSSTYNTVKLLLEYHPDLNINRRDDTVLDIAVAYSNLDSSIETVKLLLDHGADVNKKNRHGYTILHRSFIHDYENCSKNVTKLLINLSDVNIRDNFEYPAFMGFIVYAQDKEMIEYILSKDEINLELKDYYKHDLFDVIKINNRLDILDLVKKICDSSLDIKCGLD